MINKVNKFVSKKALDNTYSYSQLSTFKNCPQQYKIIYIDGVRKQDESIEAFMGKRVHETLDWLYNKENQKKPYITFDCVCQQYDKQWVTKWHKNIHIANIYTSTDYYYTIGKRCLSNYYTRYGPIFDQPIQATEKELKFKIGDYIFRGVIDRLDYIHPNQWIIHDYKTTKNMKSQKQAINDIQLALYHFAVEQNFGEVNHISLTWHFLRMGSEITVSHNKQQLVNLRKKLINIVEKIISFNDDENNFLPKESILCNWCYLWEECTAKVGSNPVRVAQ